MVKSRSTEIIQGKGINYLVLQPSTLSELCQLESEMYALSA